MKGEIEIVYFEQGKQNFSMMICCCLETLMVCFGEWWNCANVNWTVKVELEYAEMLYFKKRWCFVLMVGRISLSGSNEAPLGNEVRSKKKGSRMAYKSI